MSTKWFPMSLSERHSRAIFTQYGKSANKKKNVGGKQLPNQLILLKPNTKLECVEFNILRFWKQQI